MNPLQNNPPKKRKTLSLNSSYSISLRFINQGRPQSLTLRRRNNLKCKVNPNKKLRISKGTLKADLRFTKSNKTITPPLKEGQYHIQSCLVFQTNIYPEIVAATTIHIMQHKIQGQLSQRQQNFQMEQQALDKLKNSEMAIQLAS